MIDKLNEQHVVDVFTATRHVKRVRPQFVTNVAQYRFLFTVAERYILKTDGTDVDDVYGEHYVYS